jgi:hypothetical protein
MSESQPLRVLWVLTRANQGGPARVAFDLMPALAEHGVQVLLAVGSVGSLEAELPAQAFTGSGVVELPVWSLAVALERGPAAAGVVQLPGLVNRWWPGRGQQVAGALGQAVAASAAEAFARGALLADAVQRRLVDPQGPEPRGIDLHALFAQG